MRQQQGTNLERKPKRREGNVIKISQQCLTEQSNLAFYWKAVKVTQSREKTCREKMLWREKCLPLHVQNLTNNVASVFVWVSGIWMGNYQREIHLLNSNSEYSETQRELVLMGSYSNLTSACSPSPLAVDPGWWVHWLAQQTGFSSSPWAPPRPRVTQRAPWLWILGVWLPAERRGSSWKSL